MRSFIRSLRSAHRYAAALLLAVMVYQLGACPCGCIEHSVWAPLLGFEFGEHGNVEVAGHQMDGTMAVRSSHDVHDCTGEARTQYLNNTRSPSVQKSIAAESLISTTLISGFATKPLAIRSPQLLSRSDPAFAAAPSRPEIQVFRL